ncbi:PREDICTED: kallikrein-6-like [Bactrocera latifrons]|uniref:kallikrein-6-like n=1 Tax=Bactrocera latifrons TaxID=174628 RepID=UPI0008DD74D8|nr:PREDICTED: kallikrein-6-like [Bactrocera latifrons]
MSTLQQLLPILCCTTLFLQLAQNVQSRYNNHDITLSDCLPENTNFSLFTGIDKFKRLQLYKHIVSIRTTRATAYFGDNHICTGSIISSNLILTSAHCVIDRRKIITRTHRLVVVAGAPNRLVRTKRTLEMKVLQVMPHKEFIPAGAHDIALLRIAKSFPDDNDFIKVIPLNEEIIPNGTKCRILGWGQLFYRGPYAAAPINAVLTVFSYDYCQQFYPDVFDETMICAGKTDPWDLNACRGDAGGPLICGDFVAAVVSWSSYCGEIRKPTLFTSVYHHLAWIRKTGAGGATIVKAIKSLDLFLYTLYINIYF